MAKFLALFLISTNAFVILSMASEPQARRLGQHRAEFVKSVAAPCLSPSQAPQSEDLSGQNAKEFSVSDQQTGGEVGQQVKIMKNQHRSIDRSVAGGGVILGGLATTFMVAVFCYIRATGRKNVEKNVEPNI